MCCLVYTKNFLYMTIFICHIKTNTPVFQQIFIQKLVNFVHLHEQIKIVKKLLVYGHKGSKQFPKDEQQLWPAT